MNGPFTSIIASLDGEFVSWISPVYKCVCVNIPCRFDKTTWALPNGNILRKVKSCSSLECGNFLWLLVDNHGCGAIPCWLMSTETTSGKYPDTMLLFWSCITLIIQGCFNIDRTGHSFCPCYLEQNPLLQTNQLRVDPEPYDCIGSLLAPCHYCDIWQIEQEKSTH